MNLLRCCAPAALLMLTACAHGPSRPAADARVVRIEKLFRELHCGSVDHLFVLTDRCEVSYAETGRATRSGEGARAECEELLRMAGDRRYVEVALTQRECPVAQSVAGGTTVHFSDGAFVSRSMTCRDDDPAAKALTERLGPFMREHVRQLRDTGRIAPGECDWDECPSVAPPAQGDARAPSCPPYSDFARQGRRCARGPDGACRWSEAE